MSVTTGIVIVAVMAIAYGMGITAEKVAEEGKVSREAQDGHQAIRRRSDSTKIK